MMNVRKAGRALRLGVPVSVALFLACAGKDPPEVSAELAAQIQAAYDDTATGAASGGTGGGGAGGSSAGAPSGAGGSGGSSAASNAGAGGGALAGGAGSGGTGGGVNAGTAGTGGSGSVSSCDGFAILAANCGTSGCHGEGSNLEDFAASESAARAFIGQPGTLACSGQGDVIDTADPAESLLIRKLSADAPCGQQMPISGAPLTASEVDCLEDWIAGL
jgi:hypothetical protein